MKLCKVCGVEIPSKRVELLPHTTTCVNHSTTERFGSNIVQYGNPEDDGFQEIEIIRDPKTLRDLEKYKRMQGNYA